jgi:RNA polymerase sigma-70 factor (ECF subfamily)
VFVTAANLLKDRFRFQLTRRINAHRSLHDIQENSVSPPALIEDRTPERVLNGRDALKDFIASLEDLGERRRDIFILAHIEHMHQGEIAKLFGISVSAVEKHLTKAINHLGIGSASPKHFENRAHERQERFETMTAW